MYVPSRMLLRISASRPSCFLTAASRSSAIACGKATTPSSSPTTISPGENGHTADRDRHVDFTGAIFCMGRGGSPLWQTQEADPAIAPASRTAPSITSPAAPRTRAISAMISPINARAVSPPPSTTSTSPGRMISSAWWIARLSPAAVRTVTAVTRHWCTVVEWPKADGARQTREIVADDGRGRGLERLDQLKARLSCGGMLTGCHGLVPSW